MKPRLESLLWTACLLLIACDDGGAGDGQCPDTDGPDPTQVAPIAIDCSLTYAQGDVEVMTILPGDELLAQTFGGLTFELLLTDDENAGRSLTVRALDAQDALLVSTLFQMSRFELPRNEFQGQHGFTGLNYVRDHPANETLQYACFARDPDDPVMQWDSYYKSAPSSIQRASMTKSPYGRAPSPRGIASP